jgi:uncharacterized protein CbrC (UPF0167 family)
LYDGPVYAAEEVESVCPWCIADGSAAREHDAVFTDVDGAPPDVPAAVVDELARRTPGFAGWQQERWLFHCSDGAEYRGKVGWSDVADDAVVLRSLVVDDGWPEEHLRQMRTDGELTGYLFRCRHCGVRLAYADCS